MSIARQFLILVLAFVVALPAAVGGLGYILYRNGAAARRVSAECNHQTDILFALVAAIGQAQSTTQRLIREKDPDALEKLLDEGKASSKTALERIREAGASEGEVAAEFEAVNRANERAVDLFLHGDIAQSQETLIAQSNPAFERLLAAIGKTQEAASRREDAIVAATEASNNRAQFAVFGLVGLVLLGLIGFSVKMIRGITVTLGRTVDELRHASECTATAASQISSASQTMADSSSEQAASIEETSASSEEINSMARQNDQSSRSAAEKMGHTAQQVADANQRLEEMVHSMTEINTASEKVSKIIKTIDEIAFQTNILALNAAVEAARAGEAGLGFAVVADEVRNLAQRCAQAAQDTNGLIADSIGKTRDGKSKLDRVAGAIRSITESAREVKALVDDIQGASEQQSRGIQQISSALCQMQEVTAQTSSSANASAAAGQDLTAQSAALKATVASLASMVYGNLYVGSQASTAGNG
jgi:methyl-accepting chemotaxis protein